MLEIHACSPVYDNFSATKQCVSTLELTFLPISHDVLHSKCLEYVCHQEVTCLQVVACLCLQAACSMLTWLIHIQPISRIFKARVVLPAFLLHYWTGQGMGTSLSCRMSTSCGVAGEIDYQIRGAPKVQLSSEEQLEAVEGQDQEGTRAAAETHVLTCLLAVAYAESGQMEHRASLD